VCILTLQFHRSLLFVFDFYFFNRVLSSHSRTPLPALLTFHFLVPIISTTGCGEEVGYHFLSPHPLTTSTLLKLT
jgi:hypothetical protein